MSNPVLVTHGGAGGPVSNSDACERAGDAGLRVLAEGGNALDAAVAATAVLEDDPRLNAGTGSNLRLDGKTIEMDAAVMDDEARFGAVAAIQRVRNAVEVARAVLDTPHLLLAGEGATRFARARGVPDYDPISERARKRYAQVQAFFRSEAGPVTESAWEGIDPTTLWNFPPEAQAALRELAGPSDTVGTVSRDGNGRFAGGLSTGGTSIMLLGRVGDTPILGAGLYVGTQGAVATTGDGEEILRRLLAKWIYDRIAEGGHPQAACEEGVAQVPERFTIGAIAVSADATGVADNRTMPAAVRS